MTAIDFSHIEQLKTDWDKRPFVDVAVQYTPCDSTGTENLFESVWGGTSEGCYVYNDYYVSDHIETRRYFDTHHNNDDDYSQCSYIPRAYYVTQSNPFGAYVCGTRGGDPWISVTRPDLETKECPKGTEPCSKKTSVEDTVCYPSKEHAAKCPINHFEFSKTGASLASQDPGSPAPAITLPDVDIAPPTDSADKGKKTATEASGDDKKPDAKDEDIEPEFTEQPY